MINKLLLFIVILIIATACDQPDSSGQENAISKWGLLETVNISDTIQLQRSSQELKYTFIPQKANDRYQIHIFFPSAHSNYYDYLEKDQFQSFEAQVDQQFVGTSITIYNKSQDKTVLKDYEREVLNFNLDEQRPPSIWLASGIRLNKNENYTISINLPEKRVEGEELHNPVLVIGQGYKVSL
ncbi:hypothetical protein [Catalinimonas niigatensis]|uniref:hypothetical protein n=1 Tax=Catalinimonas niigatensis TaxID=1397264 RepID=UPI0026650A86|nr:hypothetical protein [Catalinimonas niigatensis]WPP51716.1 hypothetical protein PZB72_04850 [Catalinimonas niigatensis]